jgi:Luciferase-like monooxygenase
VLDLCPVPTGESTGEALRRSVDLARQAERWGFTRYWVAEHHSMPGIASSAPAVLIGQIADFAGQLAELPDGDRGGNRIARRR